MENRQLLTVYEKRQIYEAKLNGKTLSEIATMIPCSISCARKWWRVGRDSGLMGLEHRRRGRSKTGKLSQFAPQIAISALALKRRYPKWGPNRVLIEMEDNSDLNKLSLPAPSTLATYFKEVCPELLLQKKKKRPTPNKPPQARGVHEIWQLDHQEGIKLDTGEVATICNIRDPYAAAIIASQSFIVTTVKYWRKLTLSPYFCTNRRHFNFFIQTGQVLTHENGEKLTN